MKSTPVTGLSALLLVVLLISPIALLSAHAETGNPPRYRLTPLPGLAGRGFVRSVASAINERGQIVGTVWTTEDAGVAVIWEKGGATELPSLGGGSANASDINESGVIVGTASMRGEDRDGVRGHAVVWRDGTVTDLSTESMCSLSYATGINDEGDIVGETYGKYDCTAGLLWTVVEVVNLGLIEPRVFTPLSIEDDDAIVGAVGLLGGDPTAAIWRDGALTALSEPEDAISQASDMNASGAVVGYWLSTLAPEGRAVVWTNGERTELPRIDGYGDWYARGINDEGVIIGAGTNARTDSAANQRICVIWRDGEVFALDGLLTHANGWSVTGVSDINEAGEIVGTAVFDGAEHAMLLTPAHV